MSDISELDPAALARLDGLGGPGFAKRIVGIFLAEGGQYDGTALRRHGLAISRSLLQAMGFQLTVESEVGVGSVFTVHFAPIATSSSSSSSASASRYSARYMRINSKK